MYRIKKFLINNAVASGPRSGNEVCPTAHVAHGFVYRKELLGGNQVQRTDDTKYRADLDNLRPKKVQCNIG